MKTVYAYDFDGIYIGPISLNDSDKSPLEPDVWLIPGRSVEVAPPQVNTDQRVRWMNGAWVIEDIHVSAPAPLPSAPQEPHQQAPAKITIDPASFLNLPAPKAETPEDEQKRLMNAVQRYMDTMAQAFGYDSIATAVTYAEEPAVPKFQQEGQLFRAWRSRVWARCYELQAEVLSGTRLIPNEQQLIALLPQFEPTQEEQQG